MDKVKKIKLSEAIAIGIGGMVGGGIFAVLGLATKLSKGGTPIAFLFAGVIAFITAYAYANLSQVVKKSGGTVDFMNEAFGINVFSGGINNLLWVSYIVMLSLYANAFGSYAPRLLKLVDGGNVDQHIYASLIIVIATLINYMSVKAVSVIEKYAVSIKMVILISFVFVGIYAMTQSSHLSQLSISNWPSAFNLITGGMVIFVAYEGFELIANVACNIENPEKNIRKAYMYSVSIVIILYVMIAVITVGTLSFSKISTAQDYVLAEAAMPVLGQAGFIIITVAALISTFSAINATVYGGTRVSYDIAEDGENIKEFTKVFWNKPLGLLVTVILTLIIVNTLNLESISTSGSAGFLLIFGFVNIAAFKMRKQVKGKAFIYQIGAFLCFAAFIALLLQQFTTNLIGAIIAVLIIVMCFILEFIYRRVVRK